MTSRPFALVAVLLAGACNRTSGGASRPAAEAREQVDGSSLARIAAQLRVPDGERTRASVYGDAVLRGHEIMRTFAAQHGWSEAASIETFDAVEVHDSRESVWRRIVQLNGLPLDRPLPSNIGALPIAALERRVLLTVTELEYARAAPEYAAPPESLARLLAHEMIHRLHVEILYRDENRMGPRWFFEGFAVIGSGQNFDLDVVAYRSAQQALEGAHSKDEPRLAYRRYAACLRYFMTKVPLATLVARAGDTDFEAWLRALM